MNTPTIETKRLVLRRFQMSDLQDVYAIFSDQEVNTYLPWFPHTSLAETKAFLQKNYIDRYAELQGYRYAICLKEIQRVIGYMVVSMQESHDFGYGLHKDYWHQGYASEAGKALIAQLKQDGIPFITATHDIRNSASGEVMKRLGMQYQYSYETLWQPKNISVIFRMYQANLDGNQKRVYRTYWDNSKHHFVEKDGL